MPKKGSKRFMASIFSTGRLFASMLAFAGLSLLGIGVVTAQSTDTVSVSVTAATLSFVINDGVVAFGAQEVADIVSTAIDVPLESQLIVNGASSIVIGSLVADYNNVIEGDCAGGSVDWEASEGSSGTDIFVLKVDDDSQFGAGDITLPESGPSANILTLGPGSIAVNSSRDLDFRLEMPTVVTSQNVACTIATTFTASA